jgi:prevent-host-death family protein
LPRWHSIAEARSKLPSLIRKAEQGIAVMLSRRGKQVAVLLGWRDYERLTSDYDGFTTAFDRFKHRVNYRELAINPEEIFGTERGDNRG